MRSFFLQLVPIIARILPPEIKRGLYRLGPFSKLIRKFLNRMSPIGLVEVSIAAGGNKGMRMELDLQSEKDYWLGTYEVNLQNVIKQMVKPGFVVYDLGANIGYFSLFFARMVGESGRVFSFEPLPANRERLLNNLILNDLQAFVKVVPCAVIDETKEVMFLIASSGAMGKVFGSTGREDQGIYGKELKVSGISLDDFVYYQKNPPPQVIKIDIEGGEVLALRGMTRLLRETKPLIFLELHGYSAAKAAWDTLAREEFRIYEMAAGFPPVLSFENLNWKSYLVALP